MTAEPPAASRPANLRIVLFDLDGTLIDSAPDIAAAVNRLLATQGHAPLSLSEVRAMIGNGVGKLVERAFQARSTELRGEALEAMTAHMMAIYGDHLTSETVMMAGAREALEHYHRLGVTIAVVTNKPERFTRTILGHFGLDAMVAIVVGGDTGPARKPAPDMLQHALRLAGVEPVDALMVGDSPADIDAAKAAGIASVAVRGGYTTIPADELGAGTVIDSLLALPAITAGAGIAA